MQTVNMPQPKTHLSPYLDLASGGEEILIARTGKSVARLVALEPDQMKLRSLGLGKKRFKMPEQFDTLHQETIEEMFSTKI